LIDELIVVREHFEQGGEMPRWIAESVVDGVAVGEVEGLNQARLIGAFALAGDLALVSSERLEEVRTHGRVVELGGAGSEGVELRFFGASVVHHDGVEFFGHSGDCGDGVVEHFGHVTARQVAGEVALIVCVPFDGGAGSLVGGAVEDEAHEFAQVEVPRGEVICEGGEQRFVGGWV
jgi:hypothetical protein